MTDKDISSYKLSSNVTVREYNIFLEHKNKKEITKFIYERFFERYIQPLENITKAKKNGFCTMANCCLMIEALESFYNGWENTKGKSELAFCKFIDQAKEFEEFKGAASQFYKNIRCGILHQAETTGGWKILRKGPLFDKQNLVINATRFLNFLKRHLNSYREELINSKWDTEVWINLRKKMESVINNCRKR